jgi:hypothetical protein
MDNWEKIAAKLKRLEGEIERLKTIESGGVWTDYTPTISYSGGTTDPTSETITSARFCMIGKTIKTAGRIDIVRGSGDRTFVLVSPPISYASSYFSGSFYGNVVTAGYQIGLVRLAGNIVIQLGTAMTRDGFVTFSIDYEAA